MTDDKISALRKIENLADLPHPLLRQLAAVAGIQQIGKGSTLFREHENPHFVYGLVEGTVALESGPPGEETITDFLESGDILLVAPALLRLPYMVTGRAVTDLIAVLLPVDKFRHLAETEVSLSSSLNRVLSKHWRLLLRHLTHAKTQSADERLAKYLSTLSGRADGAAHLTLPDSKKNVAAHLGVTPATLSRSLKRLSRLGVRSNGSAIEIDDVARLCAAQASAARPQMSPSIAQ